MKQFNTQVILKPPVTGSTGFTFETKEAWLQGHSRQDINSISNAHQHIFIPRHAIGLMVFSQSEVEAEPVVDNFCNENEQELPSNG